MSHNSKLFALAMMTALLAGCTGAEPEAWENFEEVRANESIRSGGEPGQERHELVGPLQFNDGCLYTEGIKAGDQVERFLVVPPNSAIVVRELQTRTLALKYESSGQVIPFVDSKEMLEGYYREAGGNFDALTYLRDCGFSEDDLLFVINPR